MAGQAFPSASPSLLLRRDEFLLQGGSITSSAAITGYTNPNPDSNLNNPNSDSPEVDFQAAILRANPNLAQRSFSMDRTQKSLFVTVSKITAEEEDAVDEEVEHDKKKEAEEEGIPMARTKSEIPPKSSRRHRSPIPSPRLRSSSSEAVVMTMPSNSVPALASRRRRTTKNSMEASQVAEENTVSTHRRSHRITTRRSKVYTEDYNSQEAFNYHDQEEEEDIGTGDINRVTKISMEATQVAEGNTLSTHRRSHRITTGRSKVYSEDYNSQEAFNHHDQEEEEEEEEDIGMQDIIRVTKKGTTSQSRNKSKSSEESGNKLADLLPISGSAAATQSLILDAHLVQDKEISYRAQNNDTSRSLVQNVHHPPKIDTLAYRAPRPSTLTSSVLPPPLSRRIGRETRTSLEGLDWLQFIGDVIMWRHFPRSALLFGAGCFCIMSASVIQDMKYSVISTIAYVALLYLAVTFIKRTIRRSDATQVDSASYAYVVTEADALRLIRVLLPPINLMLEKLGELFSGEPTVTLRVAAALWFLAQVGSLMDIWTLTRIAYLALFTVPKCCSCYSEQMREQVRHLLSWVWATWGACAHKKAVLFIAFIIIWNVSSVSTRACGAFVALVAVRAYQHVIRHELEIGSNLLNRDGLFGVASRGSEGRRYRMS